MKQKTLTRADLSAAIYNEIGIPISAANEVVDTVIDEIINTIASGETVKLSSFGTFSQHKKKQRIGRNPKTGVEVPIKPRTVLSFTASNIVKKEVNNSLAGKEH